MKLIGTGFIALGFALLIFSIYLFFINRDEVVSPIPDNEGVRVIFVSPTK